MAAQRRLYRCLCIVIAMLTFPCGTVYGQTSAREVEGLLSSLTQAFVSHDAHELGKLMAADVDFVTRSANWLHGRSEVEHFFAEGFNGRWKDSGWASVATSVRFLSPTIAIVHWKWILDREKNADGTDRPAKPALMTIAAEKSGNTWRIVSAHATEVSTPVRDSTHRP
jgi:uncharacterized protein (TIGR02246 family)